LRNLPCEHFFQIVSFFNLFLFISIVPVNNYNYKIHKFSVKILLSLIVKHNFRELIDYVTLSFSVQRNYAHYYNFLAQTTGL
jgi:hypothetical protein